MFKKVVSLICVAALVISLAACSNGESKSSDIAGTSSNTVGSKADLKGRTISLASYNNLTPSKSSSDYTKELALWKQIENDYNCKLESVLYTDFNAYHKNLLVSALANEEIGDVFYASAERIVPRWTNANLLVPIGDYIDLSDSDVWNTDLITTDYTINGKGYSAISDGYWVGWVILFNKRLCAEKGITSEELYNLQKSGNWTWEKLREYAIKATTFDASGNTTVYGFASNSLAPVSVEPFIYSNGQEPVIINPDKTYSWNLEHPAILEAMNFCYDLVYKDKVSYTRGQGQGPKLWQSGKCAFYAIPGWNINKSMYEKLKGDEYGVLLMPKGPKAQDYVNASAAVSGWFMQESTKDKEIVGQILTDYVAGMKAIEKANNPEGLPSKPIEEYLFDDESADTLNMITGRSTLLKGGAATWFNDNVLWGGWGIIEKMPPSTYIAYIKNQSIKSFNDMMSLDTESK